MDSKNKILYGINSCCDLYKKLKYEGENLECNWNIYNTFNFIVTAWHLHHDWLNRDVENRPKLATKKKEKPKTPPDMMKIVFALRDITNSSKHSFLDEDSVKKKVVTNIHAPLIGDWASYFLHGPMIYVEIQNAIYSMWDLRYIILLYFDWIFDDSVPANQFPTKIQEHLKRCSIKKSKAQPAAQADRRFAAPA